MACIVRRGERERERGWKITREDGRAGGTVAGARKYIHTEERERERNVEDVNVDSSSW